MIRYLKGAAFLLIASVISVFNDSIMKFSNTNTTDTLFLRFFFATVILFPLVLKNKPTINFTSAKNHLIRALIFGMSMFFFVTSLKKLPIAIVTTINFSIPIWVVILASVFLKEPIKDRLLAVTLSIIGVIITCVPIWQTANFFTAGALILGAVGFASLDVFNKYLLNNDESMLMMLFGSSIGICLLYLPFFSFSMPSNIWIFVALGLGANLLLYFILKAWQCCDISALQPVKYIEFPISFYVGSFLFQDKTSFWVFVGMLFLILGLTINIRKEVLANKACKKTD